MWLLSNMIRSYDYTKGSRLFTLSEYDKSKYEGHTFTDIDIFKAQFKYDDYKYELLNTETREIKICKDIWNYRGNTHGVTYDDKRIILTRVELNDYRALDYIDKVEYTEIPYDISYSEKEDFKNHVNPGKGHIELQSHKERTSLVISIYRYNEANKFNNCKSALFVGESDFFFSNFYYASIYDFGSIIFLGSRRNSISMPIFRLLSLIIGAYPDAINKSKITFCTESGTKIEKLDIYLTSGFKRFFTKASVLKDNYYIKG